MGDRKLLELAAKAAGARMTDYSDKTPDHWSIKHADGVWRRWNPLEDDGDALRLAVKLRIDVVFYAADDDNPQDRDEVKAYTGRNSLPGWEVFKDGADPYAATRRAIVMAAASIGAGAEGDGNG